jgi:hypothetical protein
MEKIHPLETFVTDLATVERERASIFAEGGRKGGAVADTVLRRVRDLIENDEVEVEEFDGNISTRPNRAGLTASQIAERLHAPLTSVVAALRYWSADDDGDSAPAIMGGGRGKPWQTLENHCNGYELAPTPPPGWQPTRHREPGDTIAEKILMELGRSDDGLMVKELATATGVSRTTLQSCLGRLQAVGKVEGGGRGQRWRTPKSTTTTKGLLQHQAPSYPGKPRNSATAPFLSSLSVQMAVAGPGATVPQSSPHAMQQPKTA